MSDIVITSFYEHIFIRDGKTDTIFGITPYNGNLKRVPYEIVMFNQHKVIGVDDV